MVPDYAEDIFRYMRELEVPLPRLPLSRDVMD